MEGHMQLYVDLHVIEYTICGELVVQKYGLLASCFSRRRNI